MAVTTTAVVLLVADPTATPANAAWTPVPTTAPGVAIPRGDIETWASQCTDLGIGGFAVEGVPSRPDADQRQVLIDRRGAYTYCVDVSPGDQTTSNPLMGIAGLTADDGPDENLNTVNGVSYDQPYDLPRAGELLMVGGDVTSHPDQNDDPGTQSLDVYQQWGIAGPDVTDVQIELTNGLTITATVTNGLWGAWWPSDRGAPTGSRITVTTDDGNQTFTLAQIALP